jgi:hypothetical protein
VVQSPFYPLSKRGARRRAEGLLSDGRVHFVVPADYRERRAPEQRVLAFMDRARAEANLACLDPVV